MCGHCPGDRLRLDDLDRLNGPTGEDYPEDFEVDEFSAGGGERDQPQEYDDAEIQDPD
jgi:hypothetical protein